MNLKPSSFQNKKGNSLAFYENRPSFFQLLHELVSLATENGQTLTFCTYFMTKTTFRCIYVNVRMLLKHSYRAFQSAWIVYVTIYHS